MEVIPHEFSGKILTAKKALSLFPEKLDDYLGIVYILQLSNNTIKIGATITPKQRIKTHTSNLKIYSNRKIKTAYATPPHTNYQENETKLKKILAQSNTAGEIYKAKIDEAISHLANFEFKNETKRLNQEGDEFLNGMKNMLLSIQGRVKCKT